MEPTPIGRNVLHTFFHNTEYSGRWFCHRQSNTSYSAKLASSAVKGPLGLQIMKLLEFHFIVFAYTMNHNMVFVF